MKRKLLTTFMLVLLLVPCIILTACTKEISQEEYSDKVTNSAMTYYKEKDNQSKTFVISGTENRTWKEYVSYGTNDEHSTQCDFSEKIDKHQKFEIFKNNSENAYTNIRITETIKETVTGQEENETETGLVTFSKHTETTKVITYVTTVTDLNTTVKAYISEKETVDGEEKPEEKSVYTYLSTETSEYALGYILNDIENNLLEDGFFTNSFLLLNLYGGESKFYTNGNDFGFNYSMNTYNVNNKVVETISLNADCKFENNLPKTLTASTKQKENSYVTEKDEESNLVADYSASATIEYSCSEISAPAGYEEAKVALFVPTINLIEIGLGLGI